MIDAGSLQVGVISKPHGVNGSLIMQLFPGRIKKITGNDPLFIEIDGQRIPFYIEELLSAGTDHMIVKLEFIDSVEEARSYSGCRVFIESKTADEVRQDEYEMLVGYTAVDEQKQLRAVVTGLMEQQQHRILVLDWKGREIMIPIAGEYLLAVDHSEKMIFLNIPGDLLSLNE
ncbi:MAG: 16S rRNA processing protein RimM [Bacteroidales bacterium]|nr:16S rRNA processing protein RimM [Bacteroidales bacterium]